MVIQQVLPRAQVVQRKTQRPVQFKLTEPTRSAVRVWLGKAYRDALPVEQLPLELLINKPDIVHFSGHGDSGQLLLANERGDPVMVTGAMLRTFLKYERPPKLVYFNACNSKELAEAVVEIVPAAIGTTALVTNGAARASAVAFYNRILHGGSVQDAFEVGQCIIEALHDNSASSVLEKASAFDPRTHRLHNLPRIVARSVSPATPFHEGWVYHCRMLSCGVPIEYIPSRFLY